MKSFNGKAVFLDRKDINTDEIIPAKYLTEVTKGALKPYLLEDLSLEGFSPEKLKGINVIVTKENFGCGSSREHAPWALEVNSINLVVAPSFARIFRQNMFNCGMLAVEIPETGIDELFSLFAASGCEVKTDLAKQRISFYSDSIEKVYDFEISGFNMDLVKAGGWVEYADSRY